MTHTQAAPGPSGTTPDRPADGLPASGGLSHRQIMTVLVGLLMGMFLGALDQMVVNTAIRTIGDDLDGLSVQAWVTTAFLITSTISTPLYGKLSDSYGRKPLYLAAIAIFITGSALCGLADSMYMLAAFRAFQGIGAGGLVAMATAITGDVLAPRQRARYQGFFMATFATASVLGPVVGGFFAGQRDILGVSGWRWIFYINVPIGIVALVVVTRVLHIDNPRVRRRLDWAGALALIVGLVPLLLVAEQGRVWGWASPAALGCYVLGVLGLVTFLRIESTAGDDALIPLRLFRHGVFAVGAVQSFVIGIGMYGGLATIPLYLQIVRGASPTRAGLLLLPVVVGIVVAALVAGTITSRTGHYRSFPIVGSAALAAGLYLLHTVGLGSALWLVDLAMLLFGAGLGMCTQTLVLAMQNAVPANDLGVSTGSATFFRQTGGVLGTAVFLSVLFTTAAHRIPMRLADARDTTAWRDAVAAHPQQLARLTRHLGHAHGLDDTSFLTRIDHVLARPFVVGFSDAMDRVFLVGACVLLVAVLLSLFAKQAPLRPESALSAREAGRGHEAPVVQGAGHALRRETPEVHRFAGGALPERGRPTRRGRHVKA